MATFRFRAAAALERRREEETEALRTLARIQAHFHEVTTAHDVERERRAGAERDLCGIASRGSDAETLLWHRNWIVRLSASVERLRQDGAAAAADVERARAVWQLARQRRLALERMRDRQWRRAQQAEQRQVAKDLDELARIRFVASGQWRSES